MKHLLYGIMYIISIVFVILSYSFLEDLYVNPSTKAVWAGVICCISGPVVFTFTFSTRKQLLNNTSIDRGLIDDIDIVDEDVKTKKMSLLSIILGFLVIAIGLTFLITLVVIGFADYNRINNSFRSNALLYFSLFCSIVLTIYPFIVFKANKKMKPKTTTL